jgi:ABC-type bacteriocin/lantibiotic exporter with double-glycine peptidase domain
MGSGKSTIISLIERFYEPAKGQIAFDDVPIDQIDLDQLKNAVGAVSREQSFISGTIRENFQLSKPEATD